MGGDLNPWLCSRTVPQGHSASHSLPFSPVVLFCVPPYFLCTPQICLQLFQKRMPHDPSSGRLHLRRCWQTKRKENTGTVLKKDSEHKLEDPEVSESSHILLPSSLLYSVLPSNIQFSALPEPSYICCVLNDYPIKQQNAMKSGLFFVTVNSAPNWVPFHPYKCSYTMFVCLKHILHSLRPTCLCNNKCHFVPLKIASCLCMIKTRSRNEATGSKT